MKTYNFSFDILPSGDFPMEEFEKKVYDFIANDLRSILPAGSYVTSIDLHENQGRPKNIFPFASPEEYYRRHLADEKKLSQTLAADAGNPAWTILDDHSTAP